jgi:NAD+ diphosphatase
MSKESIYKRYKPSATPPENISGKLYWFAFKSGKMLINISNNKYSIPYLNNLQELSINTIRTQYLGMLEDHPCYSAEIPADTETPDGMEFMELRTLYGLIDEDLFLLAGKALQIVKWDQTHQFCGSCATPTEQLKGEYGKKCPKCGFISYPRICPAVITAVFKEDKILLAHASTYSGNIYSLIAGFIEPGETLEEGAQREIMEEVGLKVKNVKYFGSQPWPFPNSLMIGFTAEYESGEVYADGTEILDAGWFTADKLPELPFEMSIARQIINWWLETVKNPSKN